MSKATEDVLRIREELTATTENASKEILSSISSFKDIISSIADPWSVLLDTFHSYLKRAKNRSATKFTTKENVSEPSKFGEYLLYLFLSKKERENLIGDLVEEYKEIYKKFGRTKAKFWFYKQVYSSIWPLARRIITKWGLIAWLAELMCRIVS